MSEINHSGRPKDYAVCFRKDCPLAQSCLRQLTANEPCQDERYIRLVNPYLVKDATENCSFYRSNKKVRVAYGISRAFDYPFNPQDEYYLRAHLFGDIFASDQLSNADREIVTVAALSGLEGVAPQLAAHKQGAVNMGNSQELVDELCAWLDSEGYTLRSKWPKGDPNTAYAQYFVGNSYLADAGGGFHNVTFEPGCRNNWHIHHKQVQVLICVSGRGWYQEWGKEAVEMTPGTIIEIPEGVKHWHGAAKDSWFQHLTYHKDIQEGASNEWLEPVSEEDYSKL